MAILELAVDALAVHRLTRLATADTITEPLRRELVTQLIEFKQEHLLTADQQDAADAATPATSRTRRSSTSRPTRTLARSTTASPARKR